MLPGERFLTVALKIEQILANKIKPASSAFVHGARAMHRIIEHRRDSQCARARRLKPRRGFAQAAHVLYFK
ncbi:MAG: hypothetical protein ABSG46_11000 [Candidatus Binataceae bacterium]|jgi:hypothetical protein